MALLRLNRHPSRAQLFVFSAAWLIVAVAVAWAQRQSSPRPALAALLALGAVMPVLAWLFPGVARVAYLTLSYVTYPVGFVLSYAILALVYFGLFVPIGVVMRLAGRDTLERRFDRSVPSYWTPRGPAPPPDEYFRQR